MKKLLLMVVGAILAAAPAHAATDTSRPVVHITTPDGAILIGAPDEKVPGGAPAAVSAWTRVTGTVTDTGTGIRKMSATFLECTSASSGAQGDSCAYVGVWPQPSDYSPLNEGPITFTCNGAKTSCSWSVRVPLVPSAYMVAVDATDGAGNTGGDLIVIQVV